MILHYITSYIYDVTLRRYEDELTKEREGHLATLGELRDARKKLQAAEAEAAMRIGELLSESSDKGAQVGGEERHAVVESGLFFIPRAVELRLLSTVESRLRFVPLFPPPPSSLFHARPHCARRCCCSSFFFSLFSPRTSSACVWWCRTRGARRGGPASKHKT